MNNKTGKLLIFFCLWLITTPLLSQSYHAINGSPYAGATGMYANPASTVNQALNWDLTLFSVQATSSNTLLTINHSSLTNYDSAYTEATNGLKSRYLHANAEVNLLNLRMNIGKKSAIAFGLRARAFNDVKSQPFYYNDTISDLQSFLHTNKAVNYLQGFGTSSGWLEADLNFSHVILQHFNERLSAGITLGYMRGLSGAHAEAQKVSYEEQTINGQSQYFLTGGSGNAMYSGNYDLLDSTHTILQNAKTFVKHTLSSLNINLGFEYLFKSPDSGDEEISPTNYDWKIGFSIIDIGRNKYDPANGSFNASDPKSGVSDTMVQNLFNNNIRNIKDLQGRVKTLFNSVDTIRSPFIISNPTRIIINVDSHLGDHLFVNGDLSLNIYSSEPRIPMKFRTRDVNLLTVTPRWETSAFGVYLPVQYNTQGQLWVGGAVKLGPLLMGVHNLNFLKWFKDGTQTYNGGAYLLLSVHPFSKKEVDNGIVCPKF
jgi:hypothetical protein